MVHLGLMLRTYKPELYMQACMSPSSPGPSLYRGHADERNE